MPALTEECFRIILISSETVGVVERIGREAVRHIVRHREDCDMLLSELQLKCKFQRPATTGILSQLAALPG
ncbi:TPA: hypothetical protein ACWV6B_004423 [Salmonella enterica subsp. enterica serovar Muenchen]